MKTSVLRWFFYAQIRNKLALLRVWV